MAFYKEPCRYCGTYIGRDSNVCPRCGRRNPFVDLCPTCLMIIHREDTSCAGCGRELYITCPHCKGRTFVSDKCDVCGATLLKQCPNRRCMEMQFFQNTKCTACGKKL